MVCHFIVLLMHCEPINIAFCRFCVLLVRGGMPSLTLTTDRLASVLMVLYVINIATLIVSILSQFIRSFADQASVLRCTCFSPTHAHGSTCLREHEPKPEFKGLLITFTNA